MSSQETRRTDPTDFSEEVRAFYERHPYPAPVTDLNGYRERWANLERRRAAFHLLWPTERYRDDLEILVAGCGTSQAAKHAMREPGARVTGIDVSQSSLRHTRELQRTYGLDNLELHRLPVEDVESLGRRFDKIVCTGVLHHLPNPDAGLSALRAVLAPGGAMHLMVYATYGRGGVYMLQEYCRILGVRALDQDLEGLGVTLGALPHGHALAPLLHQAKDFRNPAALADALLHPQDRAYTVPQLYTWLERCGLSFGRWTLQAPYLPHCGAVARTPHTARLTSLPARKQHAALELFRGTMVKHEFVAYRDDRSADAQPISFDGERWLDYVPVRMPATISLKERLPAGAVAVLLNPAHTHTDIFLPIDAVEERLFQAIDGANCIGGILRVALDNPGNPQNNERTGGFFERLWRYDQIVFDAASV
ncbi:MAG: class I SAM-dependent methyltransferase [Gammaproteobacteria bacterium]